MESGSHKAIKTMAVVFLATFASVAVLVAAPPGSPYNPGETLAPSCAPGSGNCTVIAPAASGTNGDITSMTALTTIGINDATPTSPLDAKATNAAITAGTKSLIATEYTVDPSAAQDPAAYSKAVLGNNKVPASNADTSAYLHGVEGSSENYGTGSVSGAVTGVAGWTASYGNVLIRMFVWGGGSWVQPQT